MNDKKHWFLISYYYTKNHSGSSRGYGHIELYKSSKQFNSKAIEETMDIIKKRDQDICAVVILSISYLGHMTKEEFNDE